MENTKLVTDIIEYWRMVEFLDQNKFPYPSKLQLKQIKDVLSKRKVHSNSLTIFENIPLNTTVKETINKREEVIKVFPFEGTAIHIMVGKVARNSIIEALFSPIKEKEVVEKNREKICMYALKVTKEGTYIKGSLKVSPLLWGTAICFHYPDNIKNKMSLAEYDQTMDNIEKYFMKEQDELFVDDTLLKSMYDYIYEIFVKRWVKNIQATFEGSLIYTRFKTKDELERLNDSLEDYSDLMTGFFQKDFEMVIDQLKQEILPSKDFTNYVTSLMAHSFDKEKSRKINIRTEDNFLKELLDPANAPIGKWPSDHQPALMQQVAINAYLTNKDDYFSVNGPPGTGKTTLLKEIVAHNVVKVASLLSEYDQADDAFVKRTFSDGTKKENGYDKKFGNYYAFKNDEISKYGMLVASSNNAAVENITKDLPEYESLHDSLASEQCKEIKQLFDLTKEQNTLEFSFSSFTKDNKRKTVDLVQKDIYFSALAHDLKNNEEMENVDLFSEWGLISAPLGKRKNLKDYYYKVVDPIIKNIGAHSFDNKKEFANAKSIFKKQLEKVMRIQQKLSETSKIMNVRDSKLYTADLQQNELKKQIIHKEKQLKTEQERIRVFEIKMKEIQGILLEKNTERKSSELNVEEVNNHLESLKSELKNCKERITELEDNRKFIEIILGKWLTTQRLTEIEEEKMKRDELINQKSLILKSRNPLEEQLKVIINEEVKIEKEYKKVNKNAQIIKNETAYLEESINDDKQKILLLDRVKEVITNDYIEQVRTLKADGITVIDEQFFRQLHSNNEKEQLSNPWTTEEYNREREKLFYLALQVNKYFVLSSKYVRHNLINLGCLWKFRKNSEQEMCHFSTKDKRAAYEHLLNTVFLITPVISTTFASVARFLDGIETPKSLGQLIIDEAGQATPQMAVGALWRFKKSIIVGDPKQVEPIVTDDVDALMRLFVTKELSDYQDKKISVQSFADSINVIGTTLLNSEKEEEWVGSPLIVHRRCLEPMFTISNALSYNNTMISCTNKPKDIVSQSFIKLESKWEDVSGKEMGDKDHHVLEQAKVALSYVEEAFRRVPDLPSLYVISPFTSVINGFKKIAGQSEALKRIAGDYLDYWLEENCGTVHRFQGKEANEVIFLLGCDSTAKGAVRWVNDNIVNVAVTRAKYRLYVIGDRELWQENESIKLIQGEL
ncbi:hypothetical protein IGJ55_002039 [Enterococcus sp. AZ170]|uniref:DEAD/DEAH box helicase n=1 Tax=Enterococcus sp. AZ170 TaxID=2774747 RepID=UPI003D2FD405